VPTGKAIMAAASNDMKRVTLELGGNDAAIVRSDVDIKKVAPEVFGGAFANTGQICCAIKRAYVHESIYDEFVKEIAACARQAKMGDGFAAGIEFGPLNNAMHGALFSLAANPS
jgi:acyl-CoA reductase-like NAD-dependent aldehyde dehydrogenase